MLLITNAITEPTAYFVILAENGVFVRCSHHGWRRTKAALALK